MELDLTTAPQMEQILAANDPEGPPFEGRSSSLIVVRKADGSAWGSDYVDLQVYINGKWTTSTKSRWTEEEIKPGQAPLGFPYRLLPSTAGFEAFTTGGFTKVLL